MCIFRQQDECPWGALTLISALPAADHKSLNQQQRNSSQTNNNQGELEMATRGGSSTTGGSGEPSSTYHTQYSYDGSGRTGSVLTSDFSDDESTGTDLGLRSPQHQHRTHRLTMTSVQVSTVGLDPPTATDGTDLVHSDVNGKASITTTTMLTTTKTAHIQAPSYTSTLVLNDLPR